MNEPLPLISVIIPAHNAAATIGEAIHSMREQTYRNLEIIVVDDNSTDGTLETARVHEKEDPRVRAYALPYDDPKRVNARGRNVNAGYMARNYGLEKARGEWITFQDADDASLKNRIETEYALARQFGAIHVSIEWQPYAPGKAAQAFDYTRALREHPEVVVSDATIRRLAAQTKGIAMSLLGPLAHYVPFELKRARGINKLFFGSLDSYPASGNSPLFRKEVIGKVRFRPVDERVWPSFTGRGADRDFNFQVAETFGRCFAFKLPLYLWRAERGNELGYDWKPYMLG